MEKIPDDYEKVKYFDYCAEEYEMATHEYKSYIFKKSFEILKKYLSPNIRLLDCACGPGYEAITIAKSVPQDEVVCVDLSQEMITLAYNNAKEHHMTNMTFFQADVQNLPSELFGKFDIVHCQLSCSYFTNLDLFAKNVYMALGKKGFIFLIEPFPNFYNSYSIHYAKAANPFFLRLYTSNELKDTFLRIGFSDFYWKEILPGIGLSIISK